LLIGELLPQEITRAIYLDVDIFVQADLYKLWTTNLPENKVIAAVNNDNFQDNINRLALSGHIYFNAGVMLIDLNRWRALDLYNKALHIVKNNEIAILWWDQDILNFIFDGMVLELDKNWNYQLLIFRGQQWFKYLLERPKIIHFTGGGSKNKPWFHSCENIYAYKYRYYCNTLNKFKGLGNFSKRRKVKSLLLKTVFKLSII
jgi:lipopolysaccharide biosynthesis glycosyltransferase